jgi:DNA repair protein SbcC/Rad50
MKVRKLNIDRLPGIDSSFTINVNDGAFHVIHGPNGIGKSSICRGIEALLWAEHGPDRRISLTGEFGLNDDIWTVERENEQIDWQRNGQDSSAPFIPSSDLRNCYFLKLRDLIDLSEDGTEDVATAVRKEMAGGVDIAQIIKGNFKTVVRPGQSEIRDLESKNRDIRKAGAEQEDLQREADNLGLYQSDLQKAEACQQERDSVALAIELVKCRGDLNELKDTIAAFPSCLSKLNGSEYEDVREALNQIETLESRLHTYEVSKVEALEKKKASRLEAPIDQTLLDVWAAKEISLRNAKQDRDNKQEAHKRDRAKLDEALKAVGKVDCELNFDLASHREIFDFLRKAQDLTNKIDAIDARIQLLKGVVPSTESHPISNRTSDGVEALRKWLRAGVAGGPQKRRWLLLVLFIALAVVGAGLAWLFDPWFVSLTGLGCQRRSKNTPVAGVKVHHLP